jgi:hypothetical protein
MSKGNLRRFIYNTINKNKILKMQLNNGDKRLVHRNIQNSSEKVTM